MALSRLRRDSGTTKKVLILFKNLSRRREIFNYKIKNSALSSKERARDGVLKFIVFRSAQINLACQKSSL
ncbi:hypothetical protein COS61_01640 [Candidatus Wolfebacteria bacterium CG03_land_8_20_14_0_80_40_12]|uniref:Uncharacterized protein n=1 Tax=Candidatus Wolfebacteria bacterium CG03_land_8_20_14_0_80_40_12 TaxID=1975069 RepID=A0A2M7B5I6_9BACT|nr:MAG: hypothetical protein COS61_01640 [Candidatus Wolfebacteria bacterium CG03_land_8_20_14_0_80_40_12]